MGLVKKIFKTTGIILLGLYALDKCAQDSESFAQKMYEQSSIEKTITKTLDQNNINLSQEYKPQQYFDDSNIYS